MSKPVYSPKKSEQLHTRLEISLTTMLYMYYKSKTRNMKKDLFEFKNKAV